MKTQNKVPARISVLRKRWEDILQELCNAEDEIEHLQEQVEDLDLKMADTDETYRRLCVDHAVLKGQTTISGVQQTREKAELETRIAKLLRDLENTEANRKYACDHITEQNKLIREAKSAMENLRADNTTLKNQQTNAEHMARKMVQLQTELATLDSMACPYQRTKAAIHIACGKCKACKLEAACGIIQRSTELCEHLEKDRNNAVSREKLKTTALEQTSKNLGEANKEIERLKKELDAEIQLNVGRSTYQKHLREVIRLQGNALQLVKEKWFWDRKAVAEVAIEGVLAYKVQHNIS